MTYWSLPLINLLLVLGFNATLTAKVISWRLVTHMYFLAFSHQYYHNFSFQSHRLLFSDMLLQRWEPKIQRKEKSPQPGIELTTTRSWVRHAHHWATWAGAPLIEVMAGFEYTIGEMNVMPWLLRTWIRSFGGWGSVLAWTRIAHGFCTNLVIEGNLNDQRYRDEILARYVIPVSKQCKYHCFSAWLCHKPISLGQ